MQAADDWVCDSYSVDIRYLVQNNGDQSYLLLASIELAPLPIPQDLSFHIETSLLSTGRQTCDQTKQELMQLLENATQGRLDIPGYLFNLSNEQSYDYYSDIVQRDRWHFDLHLQVIGSQLPVPAPLDLVNIDNELRLSEPPFDGLADITAHLGLDSFPCWPSTSSIKIRIYPPVDLIVLECSLQDDKLHLTLHAHPFFDVGRVRLAVRAVPGKGVYSRKQVESEIKWGQLCNGRREGIAEICVDQADSALAMLMVGDSTVRRNWFLDLTKAPHDRLIAVQHFDRDLRMTKKAVLESSGSERFEKGITALLFLLGFTPVLLLETDSPDIVVATPGRRLVIVECTTRMADFNSKLGKLVDRRGSLSKVLQASRHYFRVDAVLVCALPKDQIAMREDDLVTHQVILITKEELVEAFNQLRFPNDPDKMIDNAIAKLRRRKEHIV